MVSHFDPTTQESAHNSPVGLTDDPDCCPADHGAAPGSEARATLDRHALERAAGIFRAAGEVSRLGLLVELLGGERCVTDLASSTQAGLSTVSQQLRVLRAEDLVVTRRHGKHVYYSLSDQHVVDLVKNVLEHAHEPHPPAR